MAQGIKTETLKTAAGLLGSPRKLRDHLGVSSAAIASWLAGIEEPPQRPFLKALQVILDDLDRRPARPAPGASPASGAR